MESCSYGNSQPFFLIFFFWFIFLESRNGCVSGDARQGCLQHPGSPLVSHSSRSWEHRAMKPRSPAFPGRWDSRNVGSEPLVSDSSSLELLEQQLLVFGARSFQNPQERSNSGKSRSFRRTNSFFCAFGALVQQHFLTIKAS